MLISLFNKVENIVGKGKNAGYQHFLLFPQFFQEAYFSGSLNVGIVWERVNTQSRLFTTLNEKPYEDIMGKRENYDQYFHFLALCLLRCQGQKLSFEDTCKLSPAKSLSFVIFLFSWLVNG